MTKIIVQLTGGLGNQLFQYAAGRAWAEASGAELVVDTWSGFVRDHEYRRSYELGPFAISAREATALERLPFWLRRARVALGRRLGTSMTPSDSPRLRIESSTRCYDLKLLEAPARRDSWLMGYWQSPKYFDRYSPIVANELAPPRPASSSVLALGEAAAEGESVAIGVRLYEESRQPGAHSSSGEIKAIEDINRAIETLAGKIDQPRFHIFCSYRADALNAIRTPTPPVFITGDGGFHDALESLWLLSQCRHHILTNSSFYWWGAWLAEKLFPDRPHHIFAADNFLNRDTLPDHWQRF